MQPAIFERVIQEANYLLSNSCTIRQLADYFEISKSTIHIDLSKRLKEINFPLYCDVAKVLEYNMSVRHIRGGQTTKDKYLSKINKDKPNCGQLDN